MKMKCVGMMFLMILGSLNVNAALLTIENNTVFTCDVQPVVDKKDATTMGAFKYTLKPGQSVSYQSGIYSISGIRWRTNIFWDNNTKLSRSYYQTDIPKIGIININALIKILPNGTYQYFENKKNQKHGYENTSALLKYVYMNTAKSWKPLAGMVTKNGQTQAFSFDAELSNDIYR